MSEKIKLLKNLKVGDVIYVKGLEITAPFPDGIHIDIEVGRGTIEYVKTIEADQIQIQIPVVETKEIPVPTSEKKEETIVEEIGTAAEENQKTPKKVAKAQVQLKRRSR